MIDTHNSDTKETDDKTKTTPARKQSRRTRIVRIVFLSLLVLGLAVSIARSFLKSDNDASTKPRRIAMSELVTLVEQDRVKDAAIFPGVIEATLRPSDANKAEELVVSERIPNLDERGLVEAMQKHGVVVSGKHGAENGGAASSTSSSSSPWAVVLWTIAPMVLLGLLLIVGPLISAAVGGEGIGAARRTMSFGKSKARLVDRSAENKVTFADVAGVDEAKGELVEIVQFLRSPKRYTDVGARVPKGVLLVGAPGTGKTLLAKAVAGESGVPFFSLSGSEFVEMFVGVGASRVRDLFEQAKEHAPCIIFIDELDAVGKARSGIHGFASNEEREQTLNQLLVEMDGFDSPAAGGAKPMGVVIMAATNRPEILDRALLRAGRFDRQVLVDRPDVRGRKAILQVHVRKIALGVDVDLDVVAQRTPGMVGADLANVVNEAALASVRRNCKIVEARDFEEAIDRIQLGLKKEGRIMTIAEKKRVAVHEAGHALVAMSMKSADPVHRVTIIPRSIGALGFTLQLPTAERYLMTEEELSDRLCVLLAGRVAEDVALGGISSGAADDLERATELARLMVCRFGMSQSVGPIFVDASGENRGGADLASLRITGTVSEETQRRVDSEIKRIVEAAEARAKEIALSRRARLDAIANALIERETLTHEELVAILERPAPLPVQPPGRRATTTERCVPQEA